MGQQLFFYMWDGLRRTIIETHQFLFHQARSLLLSQFDDLDGLAEQETQAWLHRISSRYQSEDDDPVMYYEQAYEKNVDYFLQLSAIYETTKLSVLTTIFVEMDKKLRGWMADEFGQWGRGSELAASVWTVNLGQIYDLLEACGWDSRNESFMELLYQCRLIVNVYKHGHGSSFDELKAKYSEYLTGQIEEAPGRDYEFLDHTQLRVEIPQLDAFSGAMIDFWESIPERIFLNYTADLPAWFVTAWNRDMKQ